MSSHNTLVVAIDFGTTYSGYAYSFNSDKTNIKTVSKWSNRLFSQKTPTSILLKPTREFHSFGYDAEDHYAELLEDDEAENWALFQRIKMCLYDNENLSENTKIMDITETINMPAIEIFSMAIKYLKDHAIETVKNPRNTGDEGKNLSERDINFVLTVPAIWDDTARLFMRKAAVRAGIPETKLSLALESEAASVWCQNIPLVVSQGSKCNLSTVGSKYMVVDIGGGTADIAVHEKQADGKLQELHSAGGGDWGGIKVDEAFVHMLENIMGKEAVARFKKECMADLFDLLRQFEMIKRTTESKSDGKLKIRLPQALRNITRDENKSAFLRSLLKTVNTLKNEGMSVEKDKLRIDASIAREMFEYSTEGMCRKIDEILNDRTIGHVGIILVVGGFSESSVVREALRRKFGEARLVFPPEPSLSVLKGAVLFGHEPKIIASRIVRFTYGLKYSDDFDESKHEKKYRKYVKDKGQPVCTNLFQILVEKGTRVINGQRVVVWPQPRLDDQNFMSFEMYLCTKPRPMYTDEPECKHHGTVRTRLSPDDKDVETTLLLKDNEVFIEIKHITSGKLESESFDFM